MKRSLFQRQMATRLPSVEGRPLYHKLARTRFLMWRLRYTCFLPTYDKNGQLIKIEVSSMKVGKRNLNWRTDPMTPEIAEKLLKRFEIAPTIHDLDALTYEMLYNIINGHAKVYDADTHVAIRTEVAIAKGLVKESDFIPTCPKIGCASDDITFEPLGGIWECMKCHSTHTQPLRVPKS